MTLPVLSSLLALALATATTNAQDPETAPEGPHTTLKTTVRRVVVDVVVSDRQGHPIQGLTSKDFTIDEDDQPQKVLTFEANGFGQGMDYVPPKLPPLPPNTFVNLPTTPEKGPLYLLLYDLVNMDNEDQMALTPNEHSDQIRARQQLIKFIQSKPEGARFAILVWSDGLHLLQGFTSDREKLFSVIDPSSPKSHIPRVFLMGQNQGRGDPNYTLDVLQQIARYLDGMPGRKNLIWFSGGFPLALYPGKEDGPRHVEEIKTTLNLLVQNQIAIYPVDVRGVVYADAHSQQDIPDDRSGPAARAAKAAAAGGGGTPAQAAGIARSETAATGPHGENVRQGASLLRGTYFTEDEIARQTGGRAFYSSNDVAGELVDATEAGSGYYTLTYSPSNHDYNGAVRHIAVKLAQNDARLEYRRSYFATAPSQAPGSGSIANASWTTSGGPAAPDPKRPDNDSLSVSMQHGGPILHQLLFAVQVYALGAPAPGTPEEMAQLSTQPAFLPSRHKSATARPIAPVPLQRYSLSFRLYGKQLGGPGAAVHVEMAAAAYDADGHLLNSRVDIGSRPATEPSASKEPTGSLRLDQELAVPLAAAYLRVAVRDTATNRIGATEITLPLPPDAPGVAKQP